MDDPQTGRFWQIDPLADDYTYNSPYAFSEDHVTSHVELEGLEKASINQNAIIGGTAGGIFAAGLATGTAIAGYGSFTGPAAPVAWIVGGGVIVGGAVGATIAWLWDKATGNDPSPVNYAPQPSAIAPQATVGEVPSKGKLLKTSGQTSAGHPTDVHGNKLGASGKPQVNTVNHSSQKAAKDAARNEGKGKPVKHTSPKKGNNHYHSTNGNGDKNPNSTHHEYPSK